MVRLVDQPIFGTRMESSYPTRKIYYFLSTSRMDGSSMIWGGGGALAALLPSCVGLVRRPPINLLHYCCTAKSCLTTIFEL